MKDFLADLPGYSLRRASAAMQAEFTVLLQPLSLRPTEASVLAMIETNPRITQSALGQAMAIQRANMAPIVARLEEFGFIKRIAVDGRSFGLQLTNSGEHICIKINAVIQTHQQKIIDRIPERHREHLVPALKALWQ